MAKFLKLFNTEQEYSDFIGTCGYIAPNVSKIEQTDNIYYNKDIKVGDFLFEDGTICSCLQGDKAPVAICVANADDMEDKCYRFMAIIRQGRLRFDPAVIPHNPDKTYTYYDSPLQNYAGVPSIDENGNFKAFVRNAYTTWPGTDEYVRGEYYTVEINGYYYPNDESTYAPPAFNIDGTKNALYWQKEFDGKLNLATDFDGEVNTKVWLETKRELPVINACVNFELRGYGKGRWYLPASGEMALAGFYTALVHRQIDVAYAANKKYNWWTVTSSAKFQNSNDATSTEMNGCGINFYQTQYCRPMFNYRNKYDWEYFVPFIKIPKYYPYQEPTTPIRIKYVDEGDLTMCDGYNKHVRLTEYVSRDEGETWATTANIIKGDLIERNSTDCGYIPPRDFSKEYFMLSPYDAATFSFNGSGASYSLDSGETWVSYESGTNVEVAARQELWWKGEMTPTTNGIGTFTSTSANFIARGNAMSLLFGADFINQADLTGKDYAFKGLLSGSTTLTRIDQLYIPATTLSVGCYESMFEGCTVISQPMDYLTATTLTTDCYKNMFKGCTSLTWGPEIMARTLISGSCVGLFSGCTNISEIFIYATTVEEGALTNWVADVAAEGNFYKPTALELERGVSGIPEDWTVESIN